MFEIHQGVVIPTPQILLISPFKEIWERDTSERHSRAMKEFAYIEFMCSYKRDNPFIDFKDYERHAKICETTMHDISYIPDELVFKGMEVYKTIQEEGSVSLRYYKSLVKATEKVIEFAENVDLNETDVQGRVKHNAKDVIQLATKAGDTMKQLADTKKKVEQELYEASRTRGNREPGHYEVRPVKL